MIADGLRSHLGGDFIVPDVKAGLHLTIRSPRPFDDRAVSKRLLDHEMDCPPLSRYCRSALKRHGFVLGFGNNPVKRIRRYAEILARTIEELDVLLPLAGGGPFRAALEAMPAYQYEDDAGDADYDPDPEIFARYLTVRLRTPRH